MSEIVTHTFPGVAIPGTDREENRYHDSYFHVLVWNDDEGSVQSIQYGSTAFGGWSRLCPADFIDLDSDAAGRMVDFMRRVIVRRLVERRIAQATDPTRIGAHVTIHTPTTRGKNKTDKGATGTVAWVGDERKSAYGTWTYSDKTLGIDLDDETEEYRGTTKARRVFVTADRVGMDTPDPASYAAEVAELEAAAADP